jgi:hypothetical protein
MDMFRVTSLITPRLSPILLGLLLAACQAGEADMHKPKRAQTLRGHENLLIIAPRELEGATVKVDGEIVGYLWPVDHFRSSGVDHAYQPPIPIETSSDESATRLYVDDGEHSVLIESERYLPITKTVDESTSRPTRLVINRSELKPVSPS